MSGTDAHTATDRPISQAASGQALLAAASGIVSETLREDGWRESHKGCFIVALRGEHRDYVAKIARSPEGERWIRSNFEALGALHADGAIPAAFAERLPRPAGRGTVAGAPFTLETMLPGATTAPEGPAAARDEACAAAVAWISDFHSAAQIADALSPDRWQRLVPDLAAVGRFAATSGHGKIFARFREGVENASVGRALPWVRGHGNLWLGKFLFAPHPAVSGIIDWSQYQPEALPLLDCLHLLVREDSLRRGDGLGAAVVRIDRELKRGHLEATRALAAHAERVGVAPNLWRPLLHLYWASRIAYHIRMESPELSNRRWIDENVGRLLADLSPLEGAGSPPHAGETVRGPSGDSAHGAAVTAADLAEDEDDLRAVEREKLRAYTREAAIYDERRLENPGQRFRTLLDTEILRKEVDARPGATILDVATGTGRGALALASDDVTIVASDLTGAMLARLREKAAARNLGGILIHRASASALPYRDESFDRVVSLRFLHLLAPALQPPIVEEMVRVLRTGGTLAVTLNNPWHSFGKGFRLLLMAKLANSRKHTGFHYPWHERALFRPVVVRKRIGMSPPGLGLLSRLHPGLARAYGRISQRFPLSLLCKGTLFVCEKRDRKT